MPNKKRGFIIAGSLMALGGLFYLLRWNVGGSLFMIFGIIGLLNTAFFSQAERWFQEVFLVWLEGVYLKILTSPAIKGENFIPLTESSEGIHMMAFLPGRDSHPTDCSTALFTF